MITNARATCNDRKYGMRWSTDVHALGMRDVLVGLPLICFCLTRLILGWECQNARSFATVVLLLEFLVLLLCSATSLPSPFKIYHYVFSYRRAEGCRGPLSS